MRMLMATIQMVRAPEMTGTQYFISFYYLITTTNLLNSTCYSSFADRKPRLKDGITKGYRHLVNSGMWVPT
jgi:hypothetical protein